MEAILYLAHAEADESLPKAALEALQSARSLADGLGGASLTVAVFGGKAEPALRQIAGCGSKRFLCVQGAEFGQARYATDAAAAEALCRAAGATIVVAPGTSRMARVLPGVAHRLGGRADTHVTGISGTGMLTRWFYKQRMESTFQRTHRPWFILVDPGCLDAWKGEAGNPSIETLSVDLPDSSRRTKVTGFVAPAADEQTIRPEAKLLFVAGAGWTKKQPDGQAHVKEAEGLILEFLRKTKASLGGSKSLVDQSGEGQAVLHFMTHLNQIGQTGSTPRHPKGLSTCCHGEEPHAVGWRFINERRAVNLDPNCGWARGKADVVYVGDAFQVLAKVNALLGGT